MRAPLLLVAAVLLAPVAGAQVVGGDADHEVVVHVTSAGPFDGDVPYEVRALGDDGRTVAANGTDGDGRTVLRLKGGTYTLEARWGGLLAANATVTVAGDTEVDLPSSVADVTVRVRSIDGIPLAGARVELLHPSLYAETAPASAGTSRDDGDARLWVVPGTYALRTEWRGATTWDGDVRLEGVDAATSLEARVPARTVHVTVTSTAGAPIEDALVVARLVTCDRPQDGLHGACGEGRHLDMDLHRVNRTDADGVTSLLLPYGDHDVLVLAGRSVASSDVNPKNATRLTVEVDAPVLGAPAGPAFVLALAAAAVAVARRRR